MVAKVKGLNEAMTKSQMFSEIAENTELSKRDVASVFDALETVIERSSGMSRRARSDTAPFRG